MSKAANRRFAGLLALSLAGNAVLYGLLQYSERTLKENTEKLQAQLRFAEQVRDDALQRYGELIQQMEQESKAVEEPEAVEEATAYQYVGECKITYYCCEGYDHICGNGDGLTATGAPVGPGIVAVDPSVIPLGSTVVIDGQEYKAEDTGGAVRGLHVDICVPNHTEALRMGIGTAEVWAIPPEAEEYQ